jgi:RNA recognition motif-containing protein
MTRIFVGNLALEVTSGDVREAFAAYGQVTAADIVMDRSTGESRGFGFVEMPSQTHAAGAIAGLEGTVLKGRTINVSRANPRTENGGRNAPRGWALVESSSRRSIR